MSQQNLQQARWIDATQSICVLAGITLGVIPLVQRVTGREQGLVFFQWLLGHRQDPLAYVLPLLVLAAAAAITVLELIKKRALRGRSS